MQGGNAGRPRGGTALGRRTLLEYLPTAAGGRGLAASRPPEPPAGDRHRRRGTTPTGLRGMRPPGALPAEADGARCSLVAPEFPRIERN